MRCQLKHLGIEEAIEINGVFTIIRYARGAPTIFLVDEYHGHVQSIQESISNVTNILDAWPDSLIGVESHLDDRPVRDDNYEGDSMFIHGLLGRRDTRFVGVDANRLHSELILRAGASEAKKREKNEARSKALLRNIVIAYEKGDSSGCMVLNAGGHHIRDIVELVRSGEADGIVGKRCSYARVKPASYPK